MARALQVVYVSKNVSASVPQLHISYQGDFRGGTFLFLVYMVLSFFSGIQFGVKAVTIEGISEFVSVGASSPRAQLDVSGGVRAQKGEPFSNSANLGYSYEADGFASCCCFSCPFDFLMLVD